MEVRPYLENDAFMLDPKAIYDSDRTVQHRADMMLKNPTSRIFTVCSEGKPIAVLGTHKCFAGTWELWSIMGTEIEKHKIETAKICKRLLDSSAVTFQVKRYQSVCTARFEKAQRWFDFLGFQKEGTLRSFGEDGEDYHIYARVF